MARHVLPEDRIHPAVRGAVESHQREIVEEVRRAIGEHDVVVVGMAQNPYPKKAKKLLSERGIAHHYLEYGSYVSDWRRRNALKMWTGWPTFPMIFVKGVLVGGAGDLAKLVESGELDRLLHASS